MVFFFFSVQPCDRRLTFPTSSPSSLPSALSSRKALDTLRARHATTTRIGLNTKGKRESEKGRGVACSSLHQLSLFLFNPLSLSLSSTPDTAPPLNGERAPLSVSPTIAHKEGAAGG